MLPPPKSRIPGGPLRGLLLILAVLAGLVLLSATHLILSQGRPDIRLCLPVGLVFAALLASVPLAYAAFQQEMTARQFVTRLGHSRTAWMTVVAFAGLMLLAPPRGLRPATHSRRSGHRSPRPPRRSSPRPRPPGPTKHLHPQHRQRLPLPARR